MAKNDKEVMFLCFRFVVVIGVMHCIHIFKCIGRVLDPVFDPEDLGNEGFEEENPAEEGQEVGRCYAWRSDRIENVIEGGFQSQPQDSKERGRKGIIN